MMSKSIYFVSPSSHFKFLPDFEELARMHRLSYVTNPVWSASDKQPLIRQVIKLPFIQPPAGMKFMHENPFYEFVDIAADIACPGLDDDDDNNASDSDDHDEVADKSAPEWVLKFEAQLHDRKRFRTQQPIIFHLKTTSTPEIAAIVQAMCARFELPFAEIKGNPSDNFIALGEVQKNNALVTYLSDPDPQFLESSWTHQRRGNVWFLVSPYPIESKLLTPVLPLPFPGEHIEVPMPEGAVFLAERTALRKQINELASANKEGTKTDVLKDFCKPKQLRLATQADVDAIVALQTELPQYKNLFDKLVRRVLLQAVSSQPLHLGRLLLVGAPGNGKSWLCSKVANALNLPFLSLQLAGNSDTMLLRGSQPQWSAADAGRPAKFLATCSIANPIMMFDEVDKVGNSQRGALTDTLLMLLEPENSCRFMDNFVASPIDMHYVSFILTANDSDILSEPLKSRVEIDRVLAPSKEEMRGLAQRLYQQELNSKKVAQFFVEEIGEAELLVLITQSESIRALGQQITTAIENGLAGITNVAEILSQQHSLKPIPTIIKPTKPRGMGFLGGH